MTTPPTVPVDTVEKCVFCEATTNLIDVGFLNSGRRDVLGTNKEGTQIFVCDDKKLGQLMAGNTQALSLKSRGLLH